MSISAFQGYVVRIAGGNDKQGFPMKQGVLTTGRVRLLLSKGHSCYRPRRSGERRRKSVRGCIVDSNLSVLSLVIVKKGKTFLCHHTLLFSLYLRKFSAHEFPSTVRSLIFSLVKINCHTVIGKHI